MEPDQTDPQGFYSNNWGADPTPDWVVTAMERKPHLTPYTGFKSPNTNHTSYQGDNGQHTLRKDVAGIDTKISPALTPKTQDTHSLHRDAPTQKHPFKTTVDNCSS